jgi:hypothetical protein
MQINHSNNNHVSLNYREAGSRASRYGTFMGGNEVVVAK